MHKLNVYLNNFQTPRMKSGRLQELLKIEFPLIMAPMFLLSNRQMMEAGIRSGIMSTFPSLNFRKENELQYLLQALRIYQKSNPSGNYGVNLIVQRSNPYYQSHLKVCVEQKVPFYITSLGYPREVIDAVHSYGAI